jgi:hypothetical protein
MLLDCGARVNEEDDQGTSPLGEAQNLLQAARSHRSGIYSIQKRKRIVDMLHKAGAK